MKENLVFLDTEATGSDPKTDRLCQICYKTEKGGIRTSYFKPPIPITVEAMSVTHITNKMVENAEVFSQSKMKEDLEAALGDGILVAHNALFDIAMLRAEGVAVTRFIDTLRIVRYLDPDNKIPRHGIQYLRYFLELEVEGNAHDAESDVMVLEALFTRLHAKLPDVEKMIEISATPTLFKRFIFGKYKGSLVEEVLSKDRRYMEWLLNNMLSAEQDTDEDWIYTLKHYLGK
jgi:exodeoxyribonuclease X